MVHTARTVWWFASVCSLSGFEVDDDAGRDNGLACLDSVLCMLSLGDGSDKATVQNWQQLRKVYYAR